MLIMFINTTSNVTELAMTTEINISVANVWLLAFKVLNMVMIRACHTPKKENGFPYFHFSEPTRHGPQAFTAPKR